MDNVVLANCALMHPQAINVATQILGKRASTERLIATLSCNTRGALTLSHSLKHIASIPRYQTLRERPMQIT